MIKKDACKERKGWREHDGLLKFYRFNSRFLFFNSELIVW